MKNKLTCLFLVFSFVHVAADNEIYIDQSGNSASIDLEQLGSSNLIGGTQAVSGTMTALDLDGVSMTLDINQIGSSNLFRSDAIDGDNFTGFFEFDGDSNIMDILLNSTGLISSDYVNLYVDVTGSSNEFDLVISGQAMEHCEFFWIVFQEIFRVLKPNGYICIIAPSSGPEHRYPVDCWRFYPDGMRAICKFVGLEVVSVQTEWDPPKYTDGSEEWRDTTLIAKKTWEKTPK